MGLGLFLAFFIENLAYPIHRYAQELYFKNRGCDITKQRKEGFFMFSLTVNGKNYNVDVPEDVSLLWVLRDYLKLTGTKFSCGIGECGSCTVLINGEAQRSCVLNAADVAGADIVTIEGLPEDHPVKRAWIQEQVVQCGYCQPGAMMQVAGLLSATENPNAQDIIDSMDDVICRCGTYQRMKKGIETAIEIMRKEGTVS
jgi:isoquinoline 1-oxidoreductase alpha subunit